ncbi:MAG: substrate-binding domain-containing protein [Nitrospinae bacterium]|nr:substrate-binding domain-containing protein [Nitrospinota bacterium]
MVIVLVALCSAGAAQRSIILATTTSTQDSGLLDVLLPLFEKQRRYAVKTIAVGTGEALAMGARGEADVLLVHAPEAEAQFIAAGQGINRRAVMHNDFILVGPPEDKPRLNGRQGILAALKHLAHTQTTFVSRGDHSGTHTLELRLWKQAGVTPHGVWYLEAGQGMGATLHIASEKKGYTLTDRGTFLALQKTLHLTISVEGDEALANAYSVIEVNPAKHPKVNHQGARAFADFLVSPEAQQLIKAFGVEQFGQPLFYPDAPPPPTHPSPSRGEGREGVADR